MATLPKLGQKKEDNDHSIVMASQPSSRPHNFVSVYETRLPASSIARRYYAWSQTPKPTSNVSERILKNQTAAHRSQPALGLHPFVTAAIDIALCEPFP